MSKTSLSAEEGTTTLNTLSAEKDLAPRVNLGNCSKLSIEFNPGIRDAVSPHLRTRGKKFRGHSGSPCGFLLLPVDRTHTQKRWSLSVKGGRLL